MKIRGQKKKKTERKQKGDNVSILGTKEPGGKTVP